MRDPVCLVIVSTIALLALASCVTESLPRTPSLCSAGIIRTTPFEGTDEVARDLEGSAMVRNDAAHPNNGGTDSLWLLGDDPETAWEIDPATGALKSQLGPEDWRDAREYDQSAGVGNGARAAEARFSDLEAMAYDAANDLLYAFSGSNRATPSVFRLRRARDEAFRPEAWQALPADADYTAAAWNPDDGRVYVGGRSGIGVYDFPSNEVHPDQGVPGLAGVYGMAFSASGRDLFVVTTTNELVRVDWSRREVVEGWRFALGGFGVADSRAVEVIGNRLYICDGYDRRRSGEDPAANAVFVLDVLP